MIKKVIALVFVSFFVMLGLTVLTENNHNYNIAENNINSFITDSSSGFNHYNFLINTTINYTSGINSAGQTFGCYNNSLYYIYNDNIYNFSIINQKTNLIIQSSIQPNELEIYNNLMFIGYNGNTLFQIYNFSNNKVIFGNFSYNSYYSQFFENKNIYYVVSILNHDFPSSYGHLCSYSINTNSGSISSGSCIASYTQPTNQITASANQNNLMFAINGGGGDYTLAGFTYFNLTSNSAKCITNTNNDFGNIFNIMDFGSNTLLESESYYLNSVGGAGTTSYSYNQYATGLFFADSNNKNMFIPINITNNAYTKLPSSNNNQSFCYENNLVYVNIPIGKNNNIFNTDSYIISGNKNLYIVNNNNLYVYPFKQYLLNINSYNKFDSKINNYFLMNGKIYNSLNEQFIDLSMPILITPLNYSVYNYNGTAITINQSDFTGSGSNLYYNLSIYYNQVQAPSIPLYDIFSYMYPISIIGLFVGMGAFIFTIKKRGYKI